MDIDRDEVMQVFATEAEDQLEMLEQSLLKLERAPKGGGRGGLPLAIRPEGTAQLALIGPPRPSWPYSRNRVSGKPGAVQ